MASLEAAIEATRANATSRKAVRMPGIGFKTDKRFDCRLAVQEEAQRQGCMNKAPAKNAGAFHFNSRGEAAGLHARAFFRKERQQSARNFHRSDAHLKASSGRPL